MKQQGVEVVILGVCAAGKSTLARYLRTDGYNARTVAQEHSCVPDLWQHSGAPITVYLHASFETVKRRRSSFMTQYNYDAQLQRLRLAREGAKIKVDTSNITPEEVYVIVSSKIHSQQDEERTDREQHPSPIPDEPGSDSDMSSEGQDNTPIPDETGEDSTTGKRYKDLPIPDEL